MMGVMENMLKPGAVGVDAINPNRARITLEPLERGYDGPIKMLVGVDLKAKLTGVLVVDGKPTEGIQITLTDLAGLDVKKPTISQTFSGKEGKFSLSTYEEGDGVPQGEYALTFFWGELNPLSMQFGGPDKLNERYVDPAKSTFKVNVETDKPVDLGRVELTTK